MKRKGQSYMKEQKIVFPLENKGEPDSEFGIKILDVVSGKFSSVLQLALLRTCPKSHILELFAIFGKDAFLKFLDLFEGKTLKVPSMEAIERAMKDVIIYSHLKNADPPSKPKLVKLLARKLGLTAGDVRVAYAEMEALMKEYQLGSK